MTKADPTQSASYELPLPTVARQPAQRSQLAATQPLPESILSENVSWFCELRWGVIAALLAYGVLGQFESLLSAFKLLTPGAWPFVTAVALIFCNMGYILHARRLRTSKQPGALANLWCQIILDLLILTVVVHFMGSVRTYIPFTYLFHIVLACLFLTRWQSLIVVLISCILLGGVLTAERLGIMDVVHIFADDADIPMASYVLSFPSAVVIWLLVWYLVSHLSATARTRDIELAQTNRRLLAAQKERSQHMLTTTHQLKAPFAAIHANTQLLLKGHQGDLPADARKTIERIAARSRRLAFEIKEMLQLANLSSEGLEPIQSRDLDLSELLLWCVQQVEALAMERDVTITRDVRPTRAMGVEDHLKMLLDNLLSNAVLYSHPGGQVTVKCLPESSSRALITIRDEGIGVEPEKLHRLFEEHYRTKEAVRHNKDSSGLGLAIVKQVAELHGIQLHVQSAPGMGTQFTLRFPLANQSVRMRKKES